MSRIDELIKQYCPDGVEFLKLGDISKLENNGVDKKFVDGEDEVSLLNYMDVYRNRKISADTLTARTTASRTKMLQCNLTAGDIFITPSSETRDDLAKASEVVSDIQNAVYSYHIMRIRLHDMNRVNPAFIVHLFSSSYLQRQVVSLASGMTRYGLTKPKWESLVLPVPPIEVQREIVAILDKFTQLEAELETELEARRKQYEYYRNELISTDYLEKRSGCELIALGNLGTLKRGRRFVKDDIQEAGVPCIHYGEIYTRYGTSADSSFSFLSLELADRLRKASRNDVIIASAGETIEDIGKAVVWFGEEDVVIHDACYAFTSDLNPLYVAFFLQTDYFHAQSRKYIASSKISAISLDNLGKIFIPVPPREVQDDIAEVLGALEALVTNVAHGLPAEIEARRKQYEFYRDRLMSFKELDVV